MLTAALSARQAIKNLTHPSGSVMTSSRVYRSLIGLRFRVALGGDRATVRHAAAQAGHGDTRWPARRGKRSGNGPGVHRSHELGIFARGAHRSAFR
jgi:hypothetical protein